MSKSLDLIVHFTCGQWKWWLFFFPCSSSNAHSIFFEGFMSTRIVVLVRCVKRTCGWVEKWSWKQMRMLNCRELPECQIWWAETATEHKRNLQAGCMLRNSWGDIGSICTAKFSEEADNDLEVFVWRTGNHLESRPWKKTLNCLWRKA